jgi:hypothetical protein
MNRWCAKTWPVEEEYQGLLKLYPGAKFVYIVRNGIDVVHSRTRFHGFKDVDFETHCRAWAWSVGAYGYLADSEAGVMVRHERLVADPTSFFQALFEALDLDPHPGPAGFVQSTMLHPLDGPTESGADVKQRFDQRVAGHTNWTQEQRACFLEIAGDAMAQVGYEIPF